MTLQLSQFLRVLLTAFIVLFAASCERPNPHPEPDEPRVEMNLEDAPLWPIPDEVGENPETVEAGPPMPEEPVEEEPKKKELTDPELRVHLDGEKIVLEGVLKSRLQIERMERQMGAAFSGVRIENRIEHDVMRFAVGWGNRVTEGFLIPFFQDIENPSVEYREGIITISGKGTATQKRAFHQLAAIVFQGMFSRDLINEIEVISE